jgi:hypothetical protein
MIMKVFISYAREDYASAKRLFDYLKRIADTEPWLDQESLLPGMDWKYGVMVALRQSRFVILLLSRCLINKSGYIQHEIKETLERLSAFPPGSIFLIPARLEECMPKDEELLKLNWVDMFPDWDEGIKKIIMSIEYESKKETSKEKETIKAVSNSITHSPAIEFGRRTTSGVIEVLESSRDFSGLNLMDLNLEGRDFSSADLQGANLVGANLINCNFTNANFKAANLERADLCDSCLKGANLWGANLWGANLLGANNLKEAFFKHTNIYGVNGLRLEDVYAFEKDALLLDERYEYLGEHDLVTSLEDYGSFIRYFREEVGMSPSQLKSTFLWLNHEYFVSLLSRVF